MDVRIDTASGDDLAFRGDDFGSGSDDDVDTRLYVGIAGFADAGNQTVADPDVSFHHSPVVENDGVRDDGVDGAGRAAHLTLPHAVANDLATAEFHFFAVNGAVFVDA